MDNTHQVDARYQYRFAYGDIVCYPLTEKERRWKFDTKNELGFYLGDKKGMKGGCHVYQPYWHKILTRGDVHRIRISEFELMEWYGKRAHVRQSGLSWGLVEEAMLDLLKDKPYMHASAPRPATEGSEQDSDDSDSAGEDDGSGWRHGTYRNSHLNQTMRNSNRMFGTITPTRSYFQLRQDLSRNSALEPGEHQLVSARDQPVLSKSHTKTVKPYGKKTASSFAAST